MFFLMRRRTPRSTLFPCSALFRSEAETEKPTVVPGQLVMLTGAVATRTFRSAERTVDSGHTSPADAVSSIEKDPACLELTLERLKLLVVSAERMRTPV